MNLHDELTTLLELFPQDQPLVEQAEPVPAAMVPEPFKRLLAHEHHMTITMEEFFDCKVNVIVLEEKEVDNLYCRLILLESDQTKKIVQSGIVRFNFQYVTEAVKKEILAGKTPLGRVLVNHNVLRHIDLKTVLKINPGPAMRKWFDVEEKAKTYGRLATIFCNGQPAVDLLEIATPRAIQQ